MDNLLILSDWLAGHGRWWVWGGLMLAILLWGLFLWGSAVMLIRSRIRPVRVVIQTRTVLFLTGVIFIFDLAVVPVVLVTFNGAALFCLGICACVALLYLLCVNDVTPDTGHDLFP